MCVCVCVCVILTDTETDMLCYLTDFAAQMHIAELVLNCCFLPCDFISGCHNFSIIIKVNGENRHPFKKRLFTMLHLYVYS